MYTYKYEPMYKLLATLEKQNKDKHDNHCHEQRKYFSPFVISVHGVLGKEALFVITNLSQLVVEKMDEPISQVRGWINDQIAIAIARLYSRIICGACLPSPLRDRNLG